MKALILHPRDGSVNVEEINPPIPGPNELLIPWVPWRSTPSTGCTDFAGTVLGKGGEVNDERVKIGARIAGFSQGGVFGRLGMPCPFGRAAGPGEPVNCLIYGSSTSLGLYVAQLVKLVERTSGQRIRLIGAASASKHELLRQKPYNYDVLVDYRDESWPDKVRAATDGKGVDFAMDCISEGITVERVESTFGPSGGRFAVIRALQGGKYDPRKMRVKPAYGAVWEGVGVEIGYNENSRAREFAAEFYRFLGSGAARGEIMLEPNPIRIMPGGLDKIVPDGFALLGSLRVSDRGASNRTEEYMRPIRMEKLVYSLIE
ncbi:GroES-like protein [Hypoxylon sp. NC0597]|nr:GroES-like protein [Hypoxylon sp. NC0597]